MKRRTAAFAAILVAAGACKDSTSVPDLNNPSVESASVLNRGNLQLLTTGILNQERIALDYPFLVFPGTMARDILRLDNSESRFETELLEGSPSPGGFIARGFSSYYVVVRAENNLLAALPNATSDISAGEKASISGLVRTLKANDLYRVLETRDTLGIPVDVADPTKLGTILCKPSALAALSALLDSAYTDLQAAKAAGTDVFPVTLPSGWTSIGGDYSQVDQFIKYNRGLKGKIEVYRGLDHTAPNPASFQAAIDALDIALAGVGTSAADLADGPYYQFSTASGEVANPLFDTRIHFQNSVGDSILPGDKRAAKIITRTTPATLTVDGYPFAAKYDPAVTVTSNTANQTRPIPILKNEELYLLRAQAEIGKGDLVAATRDINVVRVNVGGLPPYLPFTSATAAINALLYEKRYSLLTDGPQRLVDLRAYNRLNATTFPPGTMSSPYAGDPFNAALPYPQAEIDARKGNITPVCS